MNHYESFNENLRDLLAGCTQLIDTVHRLLADSRSLQANPPPIISDSDPITVPAPSESIINAANNAESVQELTREEVHKLLTKKASESDGKYRPLIKDIVRKYANGGTFSDIPQSQYSDMIAELEALLNE